jgi:hypothetical protein
LIANRRKAQEVLLTMDEDVLVIRLALPYWVTHATFDSREAHHNQVELNRTALRRRHPSAIPAESNRNVRTDPGAPTSEVRTAWLGYNQELFVFL